MYQLAVFRSNGKIGRELLAKKTADVVLELASAVCHRWGKSPGPRVSPMSKSLALLCLGCLLAGALAGCNDDEPRAKPEHVEKRSGMAPIAKSDWLTREDDVKPEVWLIEHQAKSGAAPASDEGHVRLALDEAAQKFRDSPRMIANRAVQLQNMLKAEGQDETAIALITGLNGAIASGRIESFGAAGEKYYNMRKSGLSSEQALTSLSKLYGTRS
jgi:hypothetical protein